MSFVGVNQVNEEYMCLLKPTWEIPMSVGEVYKEPIEILMPKGSIKKLIGHELTWGDEPVELVVYTQLICGLCKQPFTPTTIKFNGNCDKCNRMWIKQ